jgi:flagellin-specific chaperone FliS
MQKRGKRAAVPLLKVIIGLVLGAIIIFGSYLVYTKFSAFIGPPLDEKTAIANFEKLTAEIDSLLAEQNLYKYKVIEYFQIPAGFVIVGFSGSKNHINAQVVGNFQKPCSGACLCLYKISDFEKRKKPLTDCVNYDDNIEFFGIRILDLGVTAPENFIVGGEQYTQKLYSKGLFPSFDDYDSSPCNNCKYSFFVIFGQKPIGYKPIFGINPIFIEKIRNPLFNLGQDDQIFFLIQPFKEKPITDTENITTGRLIELNGIFSDIKKLANAITYGPFTVRSTDAEVLFFAEYFADLKGSQDIDRFRYYDAVKKIDEVCVKYPQNRIFKERCGIVLGKIGNEDREIAKLIEPVYFTVDKFNGVQIAMGGGIKPPQNKLPNLIQVYKKIYNKTKKLSDKYLFTKLYLSYDPNTNLNEYKKGIDYLKEILASYSAKELEITISAPIMNQTQVQRLQLMFDIADAYNSIADMNLRKSGLSKATNESFDNAVDIHEQFLEEFNKDSTKNIGKNFVHLYNVVQNRILMLCRISYNSKDARIKNICQDKFLFDMILSPLSIKDGGRCQGMRAYDRCSSPEEIVLNSKMVDGHLVIYREGENKAMSCNVSQQKFFTARACNVGFCMNDIDISKDPPITYECVLP